MTEDLNSCVEQNVQPELKPRDGIPQIAFGIFFILVAILLIFRREAMSGILIIFVPIMMELLHRHFVYPRTGLVRTRMNPKDRIIVQWTILAFLALGLVLFFIFNSYSLSPEAAGKLHLVMMFSIAALVSLLLVRRYLREKDNSYLYYASAILLSVVTIWYFHLTIRIIKYIIMAFGGANLFYGIYLLARFIRTYPHKSFHS